MFKDLLNMGPNLPNTTFFSHLKKSPLKNDTENVALKQLPSLHLFLGDSSLYRFWALCLALVDRVDFLTWNSNFLCTRVSISIRWGIEPLWKWNVNKVATLTFLLGSVNLFKQLHYSERWALIFYVIEQSEEIVTINYLIFTSFPSV